MNDMNDIYANKVPGRIIDYIGKINPAYLPLYAAIRCIDSEHEIGAVYNILNQYNCHCLAKLPCCIVKTEILQENKFNIFNGFDEVWFFDTIDGGAIIPEDVSLTSDGTDLSVVVDQAICDIFINTGCTLAMGDGCGLNYITNNKGIYSIIHV